MLPLVVASSSVKATAHSSADSSKNTIPLLVPPRLPMIPKSTPGPVWSLANSIIGSFTDRFSADVVIVDP